MIQNSPPLDTGKINYFGFHLVALKHPFLRYGVLSRESQKAPIAFSGFGNGQASNLLISVSQAETYFSTIDMFSHL